MESTNVSLSKRLTGIILAVAIVVIAYLVPASDQLSHAGATALGLLLALVALWVTAALPLGLVAMVLLILMPLLGVVDGLGGAMSGFANPIIFFVIAIFAMPVIMMKTKWGVRLINLLLNWTGANSRKLVLGFMIATTLISTIMSDVPTTVLFLGFAFTILKAIGAKPGETNLGKCLMIGIPVAAVTGGVATPAGSSFNVLAMTVMQQATGETISFLDWTVVGLPVAIIMTPITWFFITQFIKPEPISESAFADIRNEGAQAKKIEPLDIKVLVIILSLVVLWIAGNWVKELNVTTVAVIGLLVMFLPGMSLLTWKELQKSVPWGLVIMIACIIGIGGAVAQTGAAAFLANSFLNSGVLDLGFFLSLLLVCLVMYAMHTVFPVGAAIISLFLPILITMCAAFGVSPAVVTIITAIIVAGNYVMPVNPTVMLTYGEGYYQFGDMVKTGLIPAVLLCVIMTLWVPFIVGVLGF
ncbi:MAG: DASS family sodium-coupled anion symporter [Coriobacteriaceae bacterium]|jgi:sodium-dependent dicarboxylate transporter 2/3/5|nr:DASS family sodium-coupled anion symporter [Coriobacteriaceae bacterium]